jgi:hypothetical protein
MSIKSKSSSVCGAKQPLFPSAVETVSAPIAMEAADAPASRPTTAQEQRIEQMFQLASIFASVFEALPNVHEHPIATTREAA